MASWNPAIREVWRTFEVETSNPAARFSAMQVICTARVITAHGFCAFRVEGASITSNAAEATSHASRPCLRASLLYLTATYRISSAACRSVLHTSGPGSYSLSRRDLRPSGLSNSGQVEETVTADSSRAAGVVRSSTMTPPKREVRHMRPELGLHTFERASQRYLD